MLTNLDFTKKQVVFVFFNEGEKLAFSNDNLLIIDEDGEIKFQISCYRLFLIYAVGRTTLTSVLLEKSYKFGFFIALMTSNFRLYSIIGAAKDGNTLLRKKQYLYNSLALAKHITTNKIINQRKLIMDLRSKTELNYSTVDFIDKQILKIDSANHLNELMGIEGLVARQYFNEWFNNVDWIGRKPRLKVDYVNSSLDIGYTILFAFIDALLEAFGFDVYMGVMHTQFYMRKSLVCDIVEPFRPIIDRALRKAINLKQVQEKDFQIINNRYTLQWKKSPAYSKIFITALLERKNDIFVYIRDYYRAFMKEVDISSYPTFII